MAESNSEKMGLHHEVLHDILRLKVGPWQINILPATTNIKSLNMIEQREKHYND